MSVGGTGEAKAADDKVHGIAQEVREQVEAKSGRKFTEFTPVTYKSQLVNGVNYFIKVKVDGGEHLHVRAHQTFSGEVTLSAVQEQKSSDEEIAYF